MEDRLGQRSSRRMTSLSPDHVASIAHTFVSTSPTGRAISRTTSSVTSVGTPDARFGHATHSIPSGASARQETQAMTDAAKGPVDLPQDLNSTSLDDKYDLTKRRIFVSGPQAIDRVGRVVRRR